MGLLGDTIFLSSNGARAMSAVAVTVDVIIIGGNGLAPMRSSFKIHMIGIGACVDNVNVDTFATSCGVEIFAECPQS